MQRSAPVLEDLEFDDVRVEPRSHRLLKGGVEVAVEPKAFAVLLELLAHPGELVTRDALLDAVWGHRHVTPAVLNRVIALLRRALGDDADDPRWIQTVHGLGYRFVAPLRRSPALPQASAPPPAPHGEPVQPTHADAAVRPSAAAPATTPARAAPNLGTLAPTIGALLLVALAVLLIWRELPPARDEPAPGTTPTPAAAPPAPRATPVALAVLPLQLRAAEAADQALADGLSESLTAMFARLPDLRVLPAESARAAGLREPDAGAAGRLLGTDYVLHGTLTGAGDGAVSLELELLRVADGSAAWTSAFQQPREQLFRIMGPTLDGVRRVIPSSAPPSDALLRADETAQELYWRARQLFTTSVPPPLDRIVELLERAVARDPDFGLARCYLATVYRFQSFRGDVGLNEAIARSQAELARALERDPSLVCAHVESAFNYTTQWRAPQALPAIRRALELAPNDAAVLEVAASVETYLGRPRAALELFERSRAADPLNPMRGAQRWYALVLLGRPDEAIALARAPGEPGKRSPLYGVEVRALVGAGRLAEGVQLARERTRTGLYNALLLAQAYAMLGLHAEAEAALHDAASVRSLPPLHLDVRMALYWSAGRYAEALAWIEGEGAASAQTPWLTAWRAQARALTGAPAAALDDYEAAFATETDRAIVANSYFTVRIGIGQLANWAALRRSQGLDPEAARSAFRGHLRAQIDGGMALPAIDYYRAIDAVLAGDTTAADAALGQALARGWCDQIAFDIDLVWREQAAAPWLARHRRNLAEALAAERGRLDAGPAAP